MRLTRLFACAMIALAGNANVGATQQVESPVAFDSAGRVQTLTPQTVARYGLTAPTWPVTGAFVEARLFSVSTGGYVLSVERQSGGVERYPLSEQDVASLRSVVDAAMTLTGATPVEARPNVISEPARNAFARNQMLLSLALYGPLLASLADDGKTGTALYLLGAGGSFFLSVALSKELGVTRAQNHLATDGAIKGYGATSALLYLSASEPGHKTYSGLGLAGALGGSIVGYQLARGMTDAEAEAAATISTLAAAAGFGAAATALSLDDSDGRHAVGAMLVAGLAGYALGPKYPRKVSYTVTRGDVQMLSTSSILGVAVAIIPVADFDSDVDPQVGFGLLTTGLVAGALVGDRALVRKFDYSMSDATLVRVAAAAGGLMGGALAVLVEPAPQGGALMVTGGAILGAMAGHAFANPPRAGQRSSRAIEGSLGRTQIHVDPFALVLAGTRTPGRHSLVRVNF